MNPNDPVTVLPKINNPQISGLKSLGILTLKDLLLYFPYRYLDFSQTKKIKDLIADENVSIKVVIKSIASRFSFRGRMSLAEAIVSDDTGSIKVTWFNQSYLAKTLGPGEEIFLAGKPNYYNGTLQITNPIYEKALEQPTQTNNQAGQILSHTPIHTSRLVPLYHLKQNLYHKTFRNLISQVLPIAEQIQDDLPAQVLKNQNLLNLAETIKQSHFPEDLDKLETAKKRLAFEEIFYSQLLAQKHKIELTHKQSFAIPFDQTLIKTFLQRLPFALTAAQKKAAWEILQDLEKPAPMNRLLEGDVGSGKTLVAIIASLGVMQQGLQAVLLAPTEILAKQHFDTAIKYLMSPLINFNIRVSLLTRNYSKKNFLDFDKKELSKQLAEGMPGLIIGTHALLQDKIKLKNLALVIIDEQHRFGVEQRAQLFGSTTKVPHLLSLTATPIPRTLQLAYYGELDISQIKQKPVGRKPISTKLIENSSRSQAYEFIKKQITAGRQAFVITPLIDESDRLGVKAATTEVKNLQAIFPQFKIGLMHGRLKANEKELAMTEFLNNNIQILVSTSVVEVGVDVPNASVIVIEGAERFGLAQLHQFRGRVGRAEHQSYCLLFTDTENEDSLKRLAGFTKTNDGFELAELDLKQRGFGELYGADQSGWNFKYFSPDYVALIAPARQEALNILIRDLELKKHPALKAKIKGQVVHFE